MPLKLKSGHAFLAFAALFALHCGGASVSGYNFRDFATGGGGGDGFVFPEDDAGGGGDTDGGGGGGGDDGGGGGGGKPDPTDPKNAMKDSDCDGLSDEEEFSIVYPGGRRTDPGNPDTDGDGVKDGVEVGRTMSVVMNCNFVGDKDPMTTTLPVETDSDWDGQKDGIEDRNGNGAVDPGETDPLSPDTDGDGLRDGEEDTNHNGVVDAMETDPLKRDSDADKIADGIEIKVTKTDPIKPSTDGDGCLDGDEDNNQNGKRDQGESDPFNGNDCGGMANPKDTDMDGLADGVEDGNGNGMWDPGSETDLMNPDTDGDGLKDGVEDRNRDGKVGVAETDPRRKDTDCDGLIDGPDNGNVKGEDQNANGMVDKNETDPIKPDTDGDGLKDGVERGVTMNPDPKCGAFTPDGDANTNTDPLKPDTDGDGVFDGAEDSNQNGKVDQGELDPNNPNDGGGPVGKVCPANGLRPVVFKDEGSTDLQLALPSTFTEVTVMKVNGQNRGLIGYDMTNKVAFVAYRIAAPNGANNPTADEASLRASLNGQGALSNPTTQAFTTWDGYPAMQAFYDQAGAVDVKSRANQIADSLVGNGAGALMGMGGAPGPFKVQAEYVHRSNQSVVVLFALTPLANYREPALFAVGDTAGGSALAQFGDPNGVQCERFVPKPSLVDFIFVIDNSGSMAASQAALSQAATQFGNQLTNSSLDWRAGVTTSDFRWIKGAPQFTRDINTLKSWITGVGTGGSASEKILEGALRAVGAVTPGTAQEQATMSRQNAAIVIVLLGDADDQSAYNAAQYSTFFNTPGNALGGYTNRSTNKIKVHGIICPVGQTCNGETNQNKHGTVINNTGGIRGDINNNQSITTAAQQIIQSTIGGAGYKMLKPPIGASIKVAMNAVQNAGQCNPDDLPRSRVNGFDFDGIARSLSFYGACRPTQQTTAAAVSYRYWIDATPNPNGVPPPCFKDPFFDPADPDWCKGKLVCNKATDQCECPGNCGGPPPPGKICNNNKYVCDYICAPDCGGCSGYKTCDPNSCACVCLPNATCAPGYKFSQMACGCLCDAPALNCGPGYDPDPKACRCACKPACGGCPDGKVCNQAKCECTEGIG